ncbi:MAG TPA: tetratricopeptide repeat protein [Anaerolineae bacterium]|nr:tetratricopeptide repeat protein [Anaerolineae bacterium]
MRPARLTLSCLLALLVAACAAPAATPTPERLPTRAPTPTPTATPFSIPAQAYYEDGLARQEAGDAEGALQSFTWAIQRAPDFAPAYVARGTVYLAQGGLRRALAEADAALEADPASAAAHALRGETLRMLGRARPALEAFDQALALDPALRAETFRSRWLIARTAHNGGRLLALSREYTDAHPDDPLRHYYQGWAFVEMNVPDVAIDALIEGIEATPDPPAPLWFALGQAYAAEKAWPESVTSFEATRALVQAGDTSLIVHSDRPIVDLFSALGVAYLRAGRCVDAEIVLAYALEVGAPAAAYGATLEEARLCQTPTPTATPYPTATPMTW